jgi:transcriptional regulator with XRE-family HTH domain
MDMMKPEDLAERVRKLRSAHDLTQEELGERVGLSTSSISKAERYHAGDGMTSVRVRIIEELTGRDVEGPLYRMA